MPARMRVFYKGEQFTEGEFVVVNGKDIGYIAGVDKEKNGNEIAYVHVHQTRTDWMPQLCNPWMDYHQWYMTKYSSKNGDVIEKANVLDYRLPSEPVKYVKKKPNSDFLLDGWVICIVLMIASLILKPVGAWPIAILIVWLIIRQNEIDRINGKRK